MRDGSVRFVKDSDNSATWSVIAPKGKQAYLAATGAVAGLGQRDGGLGGLAAGAGDRGRQAAEDQRQARARPDRHRGRPARPGAIGRAGGVRRYITTTIRR